MKTLVICNDPPYGSERSWNGLRLAGSLARRDDLEGCRQRWLTEAEVDRIAIASGGEAPRRSIPGLPIPGLPA